jgi:hypothetical protein
MIVFLAAPDASYITGQMFVVDGGNSLQERKVAAAVVLRNPMLADAVERQLLALNAE